MSRFETLAHVIWHCQYHIVWVPKYRYRVLRDRIKEEVRKTLIIQSERLGCQLVELNIQEDHVHLLIKDPPKIAISVLMGTLKGKTAMRVFNKERARNKLGNWRRIFVCLQGVATGA